MVGGLVLCWLFFGLCNPIVRRNKRADRTRDDGLWRNERNGISRVPPTYCWPASPSRFPHPQQTRQRQQSSFISFA
uniref:Putative secreted protein n=1 Tax=Anopheles marajoara TaxID=58244 RepID=A0A2M4CCZ8_9DIPT